jgi:sugar lactone lactonase YvrE
MVLLSSCTSCNPDEAIQFPARGGVWQPGAGLEFGICGFGLAGAPLLTDPIKITDFGDGTYQLTLPNGCSSEVLEADENGVVYSPKITGTADYQGESVTKTVTSAVFKVRGEDQDEATLSMGFRISDGKKPCWMKYDAQLTLDSGLNRLETVAAFGVGDFIESVERDENGNTWVLNIGPSGTGVFVIPDGGQAVHAVQYPDGHAGTIAFDNEGRLFGTFSEHENPDGARAIIEIEDGKYTIVADLPRDSMPNGIAADEAGNLYVADSHGGRIFRFEKDTKTLDVWAEGKLLEQKREEILGPNGIKAYNGYVYVSNTSQLALLRIPIGADGTAGKVEKVAKNVILDDFALDADGCIWATTHPFNGIVKIRPDGTIRLVHDFKDGVWGPTDVIFGVGPDDSTMLYVVTDGNLIGAKMPDWLGQSTEVMPAMVLRTDVGVKGAPVRVGSIEEER